MFLAESESSIKCRLNQKQCLTTSDKPNHARKVFYFFEIAMHRRW